MDEEFGEVQSMEEKKKEASLEETKKQREYNTQKRLLSAPQTTHAPLNHKQLIGANTVAEVNRTLATLTIRREFHDALTKAGISFEFLIEGIKREAIGGDKSMDRLKAYEMLLKTLGLDKYDDVSTGPTSSWEERLLKAIEGHEEILDKEVARAPQLKAPEVRAAEYSVVTPQVPVSAQAKRVVSKELEESLAKHDYPRAR